MARPIRNELMKMIVFFGIYRLSLSELSFKRLLESYELAFRIIKKLMVFLKKNEKGREKR